MKVQISLSAIPIKAYFNYLKRKGFPLRFKNSSIDNLYSNMFRECAIGNKSYYGRNVYRLYYPLKFTEDSIKEDREVVDYIESKGFLVEDYTKGFVTKKNDPKMRLRKIGKVLSGNRNLLLKYNDQKSKNGMNEEAKDNYTVVISRHPYDILGMSTDRHWDSCTKLGTRSVNYPELDKKDTSRLAPSNNYEYLLDDVEQGTLIAYLIVHNNDDDYDKNITKPVARTRILRYVKEGSHDFVLRVHDRIEGTKIKGFKETVNAWAESVSPEIDGLYCVFDAGDTRKTLQVGADRLDTILSLIKNPAKYLDPEYEAPSGEYDDVTSFSIQKARQVISEYAEDNVESHERILNTFLHTDNINPSFYPVLIGILKYWLWDNEEVDNNGLPEFVSDMVNKFLADKKNCPLFQDIAFMVIAYANLSKRAKTNFYEYLDENIESYVTSLRSSIVKWLTITDVLSNRFENNKPMFRHDGYIATEIKGLNKQ